MSLKLKKSRNFIDKMIVFFSLTYTLVSFGFSGIPNVSRICIISSLVMMFLLIIRMKGLIVRSWIFLILVLYLYLILTGLVADAPNWDRIFSTTTVMVGSICIGIVLSNNIVSFKLIGYTIFLSIVINMIGIFLGIDINLNAIQGDRLRSGGFLGNSNSLCVNFSLGAIIIWLNYSMSLPIKFFSLLSIIYGVYVSGSRKGIIFFGSLILILLNYFSKINTKIKIACLFLFMSITYIIYDNYFKIFDYLSFHFLAVRRYSRILIGADSSFSLREYMIEKGLDIWKSSPIFGEGLGQFAMVSGAETYSHNNYIELLVSGGIIALVLFYSLHGMIMYYSIKFHKNYLFYGIIIVSTMLIVDLTMVSFSERASMLFIVIIISHLSNIASKRIIHNKIIYAENSSQT